MEQILHIDTAKHLGTSQGCLVITTQTDEQQLIHPQDILAIVIENTYCQVTIPALLLCSDQNITLLICNQKHQPQINCLDYYRHTELREKITEQINWSEERKKQAWLILITHKLQHQTNLLNSLQPNSPNALRIQAYQQTLTTKDITPEHINAAEATSARLYFTELFGESFKRFAEDSLNHALNYGYSLIRSLIMTHITAKGLHPSLGIWHHSIRNRFNLADDLIELLRPLVDQQVKQLTIDPQHPLTKEQRQQLLSLLVKRVTWQQKSYSLRTAMDLYINNFIHFMNQQTDNITPITFMTNNNEPN